MTARVGNAPLRNLYSLMATHFSGRLISFVYITTLANLLPQEDLAVYLYGLAMYLSVVACAAFGQPAFLASRLKARNRLSSTTVYHSLFLVIVCTSFTTLAMAAFVVISDTNQTHQWILLSFAIALFFRALVIWGRSYFVAIEQADFLPIYELFFRGMELVLGVTALSLGASIGMICVIHGLCWALEAGTLLWRISRQRHSPHSAIHIRLKHIGTLGKKSTPAFITVWMLALQWQWVILAVKHLGSSSVQVAQIGLAMQIMSVGMILPNIVANAVSPAIRRHYRAAPDAARTMLYAMAAIFTVTTLAAIIGSQLSPVLFPLVFGPKYAEGGLWLRALLPSLPLIAVAMLVLRTLLVTHRSWNAAIASLSMTSLLVALVHFWSPERGVSVAVVIALFASGAAGALYGLIAVWAQTVDRRAALLPLAVTALSSAILFVYWRTTLAGICPQCL